MPIDKVGSSGDQSRFDRVEGPQGAPGKFQDSLKASDEIKDLKYYAAHQMFPVTPDKIRILKKKIETALAHTKALYFSRCSGTYKEGINCRCSTCFTTYKEIA